MLSNINAATSKDVVSATMVHILVSNGGTCFEFSHRFGHLLIGLIKSTLVGEAVDCHIHVSKWKKDEVVHITIRRQHQHTREHNDVVLYLVLNAGLTSVSPRRLT